MLTSMLLPGANAAAQSLSTSPPPDATIRSNVASVHPASPAGPSPQGSTAQLPSALREGFGRLRVVVNRPETRVFIDGEPAGIAPIERDLPRGVHRVRLESYGQRTWEGSVEVRAGELVPLRALLRPAAPRTAGAVVLSFSLAVLGGAVALGVFSQIDRASLADARDAGRLDDADPRIARGAILAGVADALFIGGALVSLASIYLFVNEPGPPSIARTGRHVALPVSP